MMPPLGGVLSQIRHYVRTLGPDGGVEVCDGPAIGLDLASMLASGLPPWNVALQIFAGICEILDIAEQDGQSHGDLGAREIFVDDTGAVSIEGMGQQRTHTGAPEGRPLGHATDLYALGRILFQLSCDRPFPELPTADPTAYEDAVIDAVLMVDLDGLPEEIHGDVQWFMAKLLAHDPAERPSALETWRSFIAFADALDGPDFVSWCSDAIDGGGARREQKTARPADAPPADDEPLGGPVKRSGPLTSALSFGPTGSSRAGATAFWTRDQMKAALEGADDTEEDDEPFRPAVGGGVATGFWSPEQLRAMQEGREEAPRPQRSSKRSHTLMMALPQPGKPAQPEPPPPPPPPQKAAPPPAPPARPVAPVVVGPVAPAPPTSQPAVARPPRQKLLIFAAIAAAALFLLACLGIGGVGAWLVLRDPVPTFPETQPTTVAPSLPDRVDEDPIEQDDEPEEPESAEEQAAATPAKPQPRSAPKPAAPTKAPAKAPSAPAPAKGPARVQFSSSGRGTVSCAGNQQAFDGAPITLTVESYQLPATCLVDIEGKKTVFQVYAAGRVRCDLAGGGLRCDPPVLL